MSGRRFLFQVRNRRGLGHMMRGLNIARELRALAADCEVLFYLRSEPAAGMWPDGIGHVVESDPDRLAHWPQVLADFRPDVVLYDTMLPGNAEVEPVAAGARYAYVMRRCLADEQQAVFRNPFLERMSLILVPHSEAQFGYRLPRRFAERARFVGPIVRRPDPAAQVALRSRYALRAGDFVVTSTVGGGGFAAQAEAFFAAVFDAHGRLHGRLPGLRHIVVKGPHHGGRLDALPGMTLVDFEPDMVNLLAVSDLAVAEGGYNTVNEVCITRTPAIFMPSPRGKDDQEQRVRDLEARGLAAVLMPPHGGALAGHIAGFHAAPALLAAMRRRYQAEFGEFGEFGEVGNRAAAEALLALAS